MAGIKTIGGAVSADAVLFCLVEALDVLECLDEVPGEAWMRARFLFLDPIPEKEFGLSLMEFLLSLGFGGLPRFLV